MSTFSAPLARRPSIAALAIGLLCCSGPAFASDYSGVQYLVYAIVAGVFAPVFALVWVLTKPMKRHWLRVLIRCLVAACFWAPINLGSSASPHIWPALCLFLAREWPSSAPATIAVTAAILWAIFFFISYVHRTAGDAPDG